MKHCNRIKKKKKNFPGETTRLKTCLMLWCSSLLFWIPLFCPWKESYRKGLDRKSSKRSKIKTSPAKIALLWMGFRGGCSTDCMFCWELIVVPFSPRLGKTLLQGCYICPYEPDIIVLWKINSVHSRIHYSPPLKIFFFFYITTNWLLHCHKLTPEPSMYFIFVWHFFSHWTHIVKLVY